ncbi:MAG: ribbon-helix-helix domain-containing protein [Candidatus Kapabacteria bacterium]|nr:ribbon-helix-helix domain-containing protein [Candidatus Kapabacteria bacterium]
MKNTVTFTSALPNDIITLINDYSKKLKIPKSKLISNAVKNYIYELKRQEYIQSFKRAKNDPDIVALSEEGLNDFLELINK